MSPALPVSVLTSGMNQVSTGACSCLFAASLSKPRRPHWGVESTWKGFPAWRPEAPCCCCRPPPQPTTSEGVSLIFTAGPGRRLLCPPHTVFPAPPSPPILLFLPLSHSSQLPRSRTYQNMKSTCFLFLVDVRQRYCFSHLSWNPIITRAYVRACVGARVRLCTQKGGCVSYDNRSEDDIMLADQSATAPPSGGGATSLVPARVSLRCVQRPASAAR